MRVEEAGGIGIGDGGRVELEVVPVCGVCEEDWEDGVAWEVVHGRDWGLGRARWERFIRLKGEGVLNEVVYGEAQLQMEDEASPAGKFEMEVIVSEVAKSTTIPELHRHEDYSLNGNSLEPLHTNGIAGSYSQTGVAAESMSYNGEIGPPASPPPIYITITNPINGPSFRPNPTKPIPRWMRQLPSGRESERVYTSARISSATAESESEMLHIKNAKNVHNPPTPGPEVQKPPSQITHAAVAISAIPEAILEYNNRRTTTSTPPELHRQRPEHGTRVGTLFRTGGEIGVEDLKTHHLRALEERVRGLQECKTGNIALERVRELGSVKKVVDRAKGMEVEKTDFWREDRGEREGQVWGEREMFRKELNRLLRQR